MGYLADCINLGYSYNWKQINDALHKVYGDDDAECHCESDEFFIDFIILQIKVIELLQKQFNDFFIKYPNAKQQLLSFYDEHSLNPYKLQKNAQKLKNVKNAKQKNANLI